MRVKINEFLAEVYASLFDFSLSAKERRLWAVGRNDVQVSLFPQKPISTEERRLRIVNSLKKRFDAEKIARQLSILPTVQAVFLTGSVAALNAVSRADIDLMIVCSTNTVWITRAMVVTLLKITGRYREAKRVKDRVCTNMFLDENKLEISEKNLFTAHEILQAVCLYDRNSGESLWLEKNKWAKEFLPVIYSKKSVRRQKKAISWKTILGYLLVPVEVLAFGLQYFYMKRKITREKISWGVAVFHPNDLSAKVLRMWQKKLLKLGYNKTQATTLFFRP